MKHFHKLIASVCNLSEKQTKVLILNVTQPGPRWPPDLFLFRSFQTLPDFGFPSGMTVFCVLLGADRAFFFGTVSTLLGAVSAVAVPGRSVAPFPLRSVVLSAAASDTANGPGLADTSASLSSKASGVCSPFFSSTAVSSWTTDFLVLRVVLFGVSVFPLSGGGRDMRPLRVTLVVWTSISEQSTSDTTFCLFDIFYCTLLCHITRDKHVWPTPEQSKMDFRIKVNNSAHAITVYRQGVCTAGMSCTHLISLYFKLLYWYCDAIIFERKKQIYEWSEMLFF